MAKKLWKPINVIRAYEFALAGEPNAGIAAMFGITVSTLKRWKEKRRVFRIAIREGRKKNKRTRTGSQITFTDYIYRRLPDDLKPLWDKINAIEEEENGIKRIEAIMADRGKRARQYMFIHAWIASNFSISKALRKAGLSRQAFYIWKNDDPDFARLCEEILWHRKNFIDDCLFQRIAEGDTTAILHARRTINKDRGGNEKMEVAMNVTGEITANVVRISDLRLSMKVRKAILEAIRENTEDKQAG